jgi:uncharacterized protein YggT (Ycf19 family)
MIMSDRYSGVGNQADQEIVTRIDQQEVITRDGGVIGQEVGVAEHIDRVEARRSTVDWLAGVVYLVVGIISILIALRVVLKLLAANPESGFTRFVYGSTGPLVAPFQGIFGTSTAAGMVFEASSVLAMAIYLLGGWLIVRILALVIDRPTSGVTVSRSVGQRAGRQ